ncbi:MAG: GNAT family N-acetyltransferase [Woeseiaceae bacterium]|nr:GNAT family N-acetyltransferase [Woeseiaceae bacterium]
MTVTAVEILAYEPRLAPEFRDLNVEWLEKYFRVEPVDRKILDDPSGQVIDGGGAILFAALEGRVVGTVALKHHGDRVFELTKMAVTPRCQGAGIGRLLMQACLEKYREIGGRRLFLESHSSLQAALALYESAGFYHQPRPKPSDYERSDVYMVFRQD